MHWLQSLQSDFFRRRALRLRRAGNAAPALAAMRAAARHAPREQERPLLLCQQAELEAELGQTRQALETYHQAKALMKKHSRFWRVGAHQGRALEIDGAIAALERHLAHPAPDEGDAG